MIWCDWAHRLFYVVWGVVEYILAILGDIKCDSTSVERNIKELNKDGNNKVDGNARLSYWNRISLERESDCSVVIMNCIAS